jgi:hypothetical protein
LRLSLGHLQDFFSAPGPRVKFPFTTLEGRIVKFLRGFVIFFERLRADFRIASRKRDASFLEALQHSVAAQTLNIESLEFMYNYLTDELIFFGAKRQVGKFVIELATLLFASVLRHEIFTQLLQDISNSTTSSNTSSLSTSTASLTSPITSPSAVRLSTVPLENSTGAASSSSAVAVTHDQPVPPPNNGASQWPWEHAPTLQVLQRWLDPVEAYFAHFPRHPSQLNLLRTLKDELRTKINAIWLKISVTSGGANAVVNNNVASSNNSGNMGSTGNTSESKK